MSTIKISELYPVGSELFQDSESYLNELNDQEMLVMGGKKNKYKFVITSVIEVISQASVSNGFSLNTFSFVTGG
ncbi:hypothetical protein [Calothrix sp. 336/3]|uniref:hypothetical protein n=1 Tax=Calothrix sp. 336/3 TaxID=1337936 RepID=UPI0004E2E64E|nr:hypothetical protein [Calothrix sp. 336/3]AKG20536.1 hypothetical protein IJ00_03690 [Calothrix sp. 336/3]